MNKLALALLVLTPIATVVAKEKKVQHDAHEHGVAEMNVIWEKQALNIELLSPAFNITGFEHQPSNHEQEEAIEKIEKKLNLANELFEIKGASCTAKNIEIESPFEDHHDHEDHDKHEAEDKHDDHDHAKHDDHDDHKEHADHDDHKDHKSDDEHHDHAKESSTHSEYTISYEFNCENIKSELTIETAQLFKHLPQMEKIKVQWLSATSQSSSILSQKNYTFTLK